MKNLELKVSVNSFGEIIDRLKKLGAKFSGTLNQKDVYYKVASGRLKTREINSKNFELIFYHRPATKNSKFSDYQIFKFSKNQFKTLFEVLDEILARKSVVEKKRLFWQYQRTRIHLDRVKGLGNFLELETVIKDISDTEAKKEHQNIIKLLNLKKYKKVNKSYGEMLIV